jgi:molecular chaperone HscB
MDLLRKTDFELFSIEPKFELNLEALSEAFLKLQLLMHPDRFAAGTDSEKRLSLQITTRINEAYQRLKTPLTRATYLCELNGAAINADTNTAMPSAFLVEQMQWREALEESDVNLGALKAEVQTKQAALLSDLTLQLDQEHHYAAAAASVRQLMFVEKFLQTIQSHSPVHL